MVFRLRREDRYPAGTVVEVYDRAAWQPTGSPTGAMVTSAEMDATSGAVFTGLDENGRYVSYALVNGEHRYIHFKAPARSERAPEAGDVANYDPATGKFAYRNPRFVDLLADGFGVTDAEDVSAYEGEVNAAAFQDFMEKAAEIGEGYVGVCTIELNGTTRRPPGLRLIGAGRGLTTIRSHVDYARNGPIVSNEVDANGDALPMSGYEEGITYDGQYLNNTDYNIRCNVVGDHAADATTITVDSTEDFADAGRVSFVALGDNVSRATYTSKDATHFYGWTWQIDSDHVAAEIPDGTELRKFDSSVTGLVRFYNIDGLHYQDCEFMRSASYCLAGEGRPYDTDESHRTKRYLRLTQCRIHDSYMSDGVDVKGIESFFASQTEFTDCGDKGVNVRGLYQHLEDCVTKRNRTGFGLTSSPAVADADRVSATLNGATTRTATSIVVTSTADLPASGAGWINNTERVTFTVADATHITAVRGVRSTQPAAHADDSSLLVDYDVEDATIADASIGLFNCHSYGDNTGMALSAGGSYTRAEVHGGTIRGCTLGLQLSAALGVMEAKVFGTTIWENQTNVKATQCAFVGLYGVLNQSALGNDAGDPGTDADGTGVILDRCSNKNEIVGGEIADCAGWGVQTLGTTDHLYCSGVAPHGNTLGVWSLSAQTLDTTGDWFGVRQPGFIPRAVHETVPIEQVTADALTMVTDTVYAAPFRARATHRVTVLTTYVTTASGGSPTHAKLALLELSGTNWTTFTRLAMTDDHPGGVFTSTGFKNNLTLESSGKVWLEAGKVYAVAILWTGTSAPKLAGLAPAVVDTATSYRPLLAGTVAAASSDIPASGTLTPTLIIPYLGAANGG